MTDEEQQIFELLSPSAIDSAAPDLHAVRCRILLALQNAHVPMEWEVRLEQAKYVCKLPHVSARCRLAEEDERRCLVLVKEYQQCLELVKRLMEGNASRGLPWLLREAPLQARHIPTFPHSADLQWPSLTFPDLSMLYVQLRAKDPPLFASEEQLKHMINWIQQRRNRIEIPEHEQRLLDNRRELLRALAAEFDTPDAHLEVTVQRADGHEGTSTVLRYDRSAAEGFVSENGSITCEQLHTPAYDVSNLAGLVHRVCEEFACRYAISPHLSTSPNFHELHRPSAFSTMVCAQHEGRLEE